MLHDVPSVSQWTFLIDRKVLSGSRHIVQPSVVVVAADFGEMVVSVGGRLGVVMMLMDGDGTA